MTEKRFTIEIDDENIVHILDDETDVGQYNLCKLLNELYEENKALKGKASSWKITASEEISEKQELIKQITKLKEENEQLKKQVIDCEKFRHAVYQGISKEMSKHD